ncbi:MAG: hypothetical protein GEU78_18845 [Actinobacteria bacterium]|nr:hypothetical protein [Actinomycetota bacterium]
MNTLTIVWWGATLGGVVAALVAVLTPSGRRPALLVAASLFLISGVLGILSIGVVFLVLAVVCVIAAVLSHSHQSSDRSPSRT